MDLSWIRHSTEQPCPERARSQAAAHHLCCKGWGREGRSTLQQSFYAQPTFHSNPVMLSASLGAAGSKFSSLLALARIQLLSPTHIPAALCSSLDIGAETLPKEHWGKPWVTCSAPGTDPAMSWRLYQRVPNTSSNPNNYIIFMNYKNVLAFFIGLSWATGVLILNK